MHLRSSDRPPADQRLAVFAVDGCDGFRPNPVSAKRRLQCVKRIVDTAGTRTARIDLLQRDHVRPMALNKSDHLPKLEAWVAAKDPGGRRDQLTNQRLADWFGAIIRSARLRGRVSAKRSSYLPQRNRV
jgi:hypothetical protein